MNKIYCPRCCKEINQNELLIGIGGCIYCPENESFVNKKDKYELGDDVEGTCPNCAGRGRKQHLEYNGDGEVIWVVCSKIFKLSEIGK